MLKLLTDSNLVTLYQNLPHSAAILSLRIYKAVSISLTNIIVIYLVVFVDSKQPLILRDKVGHHNCNNCTS